MRMSDEETKPTTTATVATNAPATTEKKKWVQKPGTPPSVSIARIWVNTSKGENGKKVVEYLKLYIANGTAKDDEVTVFKTKPTTNPDAGDYEMKDKESGVVRIKANKMVVNEKETMKIEFFDNKGSFQKSFIARKTIIRKSETSPHYVAFSDTLKLAKV